MFSGLFRHSGGQSSQLLLISLLLTRAASQVCEDEQCEMTGASAVPASNLLQISTNSDGHEDMFGPGLCVGVKRNAAGSCVLRTRCAGKNISQTDFSFICFNPIDTIPHAMHSFGRGGFTTEESFDTKVHCKTCLSVDTAFRTGDSVVKNALAALPLSRLPSLTGALKNGPAYSANELKTFKPKEAAVFGPSYCISTFKAPAGSCLIRTRCANVELNKFNVGITCLDKSGGYTRYLFGKDAFKEEETFDTLISCEKCLGVGPESSIFALHGLMPKKLVEDVSSLKMDVETLNEKVRVIQQYSAAQQEESSRQAKERSDHKGKGSEDYQGHQEAKTEEHDSHLAAEQGDESMPTIMMERSNAISNSDSLEQDQAETASIDVGQMQMISHSRVRGGALAELLRRVANP